MTSIKNEMHTSFKILFFWYSVQENNNAPSLEDLIKGKVSEFEKHWSAFATVLNSTIDNPTNKENIESLISKTELSLNPDVFKLGADKKEVDISDLEKRVMNVVAANIDKNSKFLNVTSWFYQTFCCFKDIIVLFSYYKTNVGPIFQNNGTELDLIK
jgi:hypothetical protein